MKDPILDQPFDNEPSARISWMVTALAALLLLTGTNMLVAHGFIELLPYLMMLVSEQARTAEEVKEVVIKIIIVSNLLSSLIIGIGWGSMLAKNRELLRWQILVLAFLVGLTSLVIRPFTGFYLSIEQMMPFFSKVLFFIISQSVIFAAIVFTTVTHRRGQGYSLRYRALSVTVLLPIIYYILVRLISIV